MVTAVPWSALVPVAGFTRSPVAVLRQRDVGAPELRRRRVDRLVDHGDLHALAGGLPVGRGRASSRRTTRSAGPGLRAGAGVAAGAAAAVPDGTRPGAGGRSRRRRRRARAPRADTGAGLVVRTCCPRRGVARRAVAGAGALGGTGRGRGRGRRRAARRRPGWSPALRVGGGEVVGLVVRRLVVGCVGVEGVPVVLLGDAAAAAPATASSVLSWLFMDSRSFCRKSCRSRDHAVDGLARRPRGRPGAGGPAPCPAGWPPKAADVEREVRGSSGRLWWRLSSAAGNVVFAIRRISSMVTSTAVAAVALPVSGITVRYPL